MRTLSLVVVSGAAFLLAAKIHGRQLRLEREAHGVRSVVFGGRNPPVVEAIWRAERLRFWTLAPTLALATGLALSRLGAARAAVLVGALLWAPSAAFL